MSISQFPPPASPSPSPSPSPASLSSSSSEFVPAMKFAALSDMVGIKEKTLKKLSKQQSSYRIKASIFVQGNEKMAEELVEMFKRRVILKDG